MLTDTRRAIARTISTTTHGRYLLAAAASRPAPLLLGFHGYSESADVQLERLRSIPGSDRWTIVSVQGLHRFYLRRSELVVASWMTSQDRELAIADNIAYVAAIIEAERSAPLGSTAAGSSVPRSSVIAFAGFSQGVAMAFRAAASCAQPVAGVIAVGGDVPPEIDRVALGRVRRVLLCRGARDPWYAPETFENDERRLREALVDVRPTVLDCSHEWSDGVAQAASVFLRELIA